MIHNLIYIELKTGYSDNGPAWIGYVKKAVFLLYIGNTAFCEYLIIFINKEKVIAVSGK